MKNDENSVNLSRRDFFKELGMIGGGGALLSRVSLVAVL